MHVAASQLRTVMAARPVVGTFLLEFCSPSVVHVMADIGLDFVLIDCEHGHCSSREAETVLEAAWSRSLPALVRVGSPDRALITRVLDAGAAGILVPAISSLSEVEQVVRASKYRPLGRRGVHMLRPHTRHRPPSKLREYLQSANRDLLTLIQIELAPAVELVEQIAAMPGVDGLYVGPGDLSVDLDRPGEWDSDEIWQAIAATAAACRKHQKFLGCHYDSVELLPRLMQMGVHMLGHGCDLGIFRSACAHIVDGAAAALRTASNINSILLSSEGRPAIPPDERSRVPSPSPSRSGGCYDLASKRVYAD
jgi:4-hydroxy-2-oxoheptanedioate aldolase